MKLCCENTDYFVIIDSSMLAAKMQVAASNCLKQDLPKTLFVILIKLITKSRCVPLALEEQTGILRRNRGSQESEPIRFLDQLTWHRIIVVLLLAQRIAFPCNNFSISGKIIGWLSLLIHAGTHLELYSCHSKSIPIVIFVNGLFQFIEHTRILTWSRKRTFTENMNFLLAASCIVEVAWLPVALVFGLMFLSPNRDVLLGYPLLNKFESTLISALINVIVFVLNYWIWLIACLAAIFCICGFQSLCTIMLRDCIHTFHNMDTEDEQHVPFGQKAIRYREIQLLATLQAEIQSGSLMTLLILIPTVAISSASAIIIRIPWTIQNLVILMFSSYLSTGCTVVTLFVVGAQAGVWTESKNLIRGMENLKVIRMKRGESIKKLDMKVEQRFWKSCQNLIKVKFGVNNFVEDETPLNCLNYAVHLAVQLLLLQG